MWEVKMVNSFKIQKSGMKTHGEITFIDEQWCLYCDLLSTEDYIEETEIWDAPREGWEIVQDIMVSIMLRLILGDVKIEKKTRETLWCVQI